MIPKVIHYCWFGENKLPDSALKYINSWKKKNPEYQIIQWNEKNFDIDSAPLYVQQAYECKKWAFVTDYARLKVIFDHGGIYLDTDVEVKKSFNELLHYQAFFAKEDALHVATGLGFGAEKGSKIVSDLLNDYHNIGFIKSDGSLDLTPCPARNKHVFERYGVESFDKKQILKGNILILPTIYMCPLSYQTGKMRHSFKTISIHWFSASWKESGEQDAHWVYVKKKRISDTLDYIKHTPNRLLMRLLGEEHYDKVKKILKRY